MYELVQYNDAHRSSGSSPSALRSMNRPVFHRLAYPLALVIVLLASGLACAQVDCARGAEDRGNARAR